MENFKASLMIQLRFPGNTVYKWEGSVYRWFRKNLC